MDFKMKFSFTSAPRHQNDPPVANSTAIGISCKLLAHMYPCWLVDEKQRVAGDRESPPCQALARHATVCCGSSCTSPI